jgi:hypothetical protein
VAAEAVGERPEDPLSSCPAHGCLRHGTHNLRPVGVEALSGCEAAPGAGVGPEHR